MARGIHMFEVIKTFPYSDSKTSGDSCPEGSSFAHFWAVDVDPNEVGLCLHGQVRVAHSAIDGEFRQLGSAKG